VVLKGGFFLRVAVPITVLFFSAVKKNEKKRISTQNCFPERNLNLPIQNKRISPFCSAQNSTPERVVYYIFKLRKTLSSMKKLVYNWFIAGIDNDDFS
jgi:hypothetical protein